MTLSLTDKMFAEGLVDEALEVIELDKAFKALKGEVEQAELICPDCKIRLTRFHFIGYYDEHSGWYCNCEFNSKEANVKHWRGGYA